MNPSFSYSFGFVVLMIASMLVVAQNNNPCEGIKDCVKCVSTNFTTAFNATANTTASCVFRYTEASPVECVAGDGGGEGDNPYRNLEDCKGLNPDPPSNTTTTTPATTTTATTPAPTTTTSTTVTPPTTPPTTNATTTTPATTTTVITTTTAAPNTTTPTGPTTTSAPPTSATPTATPAPRGGGGMSVASFFGGIVFTLCVSAVGYLVWRFYKARLDRNYHTLSTNLI